jgi:hypothetical protein
MVVGRNKDAKDVCLGCRRRLPLSHLLHVPAVSFAGVDAGLKAG